MLDIDAITTCHTVYLCPIHPSEVPTIDHETKVFKNMPSDLVQLLWKFIVVFSIPRGFPPFRTHDHHIHLEPNSKAMNCKPCRYPHFQKQAMTKIIIEMLSDGLI